MLVGNAHGPLGLCHSWVMKSRCYNCVGCTSCVWCYQSIVVYFCLLVYPWLPQYIVVGSMALRNFYLGGANMRNVCWTTYFWREQMCANGVRVPTRACCVCYSVWVGSLAHPRTAYLWKERTSWFSRRSVDFGLLYSRAASTRFISLFQSWPRLYYCV